MSTRRFGVALCALASLLMAIAFSPVMSDFLAFSLYGKAPSLSSIADSYSSIGSFLASLRATAATPTGLPSIGVSFCLLFAILMVLNMDIFAEPKNRTLKNGELGKQNQITRKGAIARANIVWDEEKRSDGPAICIGCINGKSVFAEAIHAMAIAPSGSSKTRGSLFQTLDYNTWNGSRNVLVMDPSLEVYAQSHTALEKRGYRIRVLDPEIVTDSFNPLASLVSLCKEGEHAQAQERAREIGAILFPATGGENDWVMDDSAGPSPAYATQSPQIRRSRSKARTSGHAWQRYSRGPKEGMRAP